MVDSETQIPDSLAEQLNRDCFCIGADLAELRERLETELWSRGVVRPVVESHPHLFSVLPVFVSRADLARSAVVTPYPRAHALYANKLNLTVLTDANALERLGASGPTTAALVGGIARTRAVASADRSLLWKDRKRLFFKPAAGYGARGAYRGDKLTPGHI